MVPTAAVASTHSSLPSEPKPTSAASDRTMHR
jgi:hypothetical protein